MKISRAVILATICASGIHAESIATESRLRSIVQDLSSSPRNWQDTSGLNKAAKFISQKFANFGLVCQDQLFEVEQKIYRNTECILPGKTSDVIVVGAHYDVAGINPGADDNASGVAGLLELARKFTESNVIPKSTIRFVAFSLEEPPFYNTENMGSYIHAKKIKDSAIALKQMISLEMIGYYSDSAIQYYPAGIDKRKMSKYGNFYAAISNLQSANLTMKFKSVADKLKTVNTISYNAEDGVEWSDHMNYWKFGFPAFMITDTAFLRNKHYHKATDTPDTLNYIAMSGLLDVIFAYLKNA